MSYELGAVVTPPTAKGAAGLRAFILYLKDFFRHISPRAILFTLVFIAILISLNYTVGIESRIHGLHPWPLSLLGFFLFYSFVFFGAWSIQWVCPRKQEVRPEESVPGVQGIWSGETVGRPGMLIHTETAEKPLRRFGRSGSRYWWFLLTLAPLFFAFKVVHWDLSLLIPAAWPTPWARYALVILQLPAKLLTLVLMLAACRKIFRDGAGGEYGNGRQGSGDGTGSFFGFTASGFSARPYFLILLSLLPLIALASTQHDFLLAYPKVRMVAFINGYAHPSWPWKLLFEISYGLDFVSIELFFRGFLVIGLARWAGRDVILPMAAFYCTIHFGKPLGECISSFFGGMALGVIAWRTRSILGGLIVHLGLAWLMEIGGWIGNG